MRNEVCSVSQTYLNTEYCFRDSCAIGHVRKWWYVPQKYAGVQSSGRAEKEDFISHRRSKFEWISWNHRRLVLIISVSSVPVPSIVDIEQISVARILADYDLNE